MDHTRFVGLDIHKERISVAVAESGRSGAVEYLGEISNDAVAIDKLCERLARPGKPLAFSYEAVAMQSWRLSPALEVPRPSVQRGLGAVTEFRKRSGDRVKTNRRDATMLARLHRAGELTPVWVPDADHEAMRDLIRLRGAVRQVVTRARQHLQGFLLRHGRKHGRGTAYRKMAYRRRWLSTLSFEHPAQQIAFQDYVDAVMDGERSPSKRVEEQIFGLLPDWNLRPVVDALQAMRGTRADQCGGAGDRSRRFHSLPESAPAHGVFRPCPRRAIEWRGHSAQRYHEDRQQLRRARCAG